MKTKILKLTAVFLLLAGVVSCGKDEPKYEIYEKNDISVCGIDDPLNNLEWLKTEIDEIMKEKNDISSSFNIDLYEENETKNHLILIPYTPNKKAFYYSVYNCDGEITSYFAGTSGEQSSVPPSYPLHSYCTYICTIWSITLK